MKSRLPRSGEVRACPDAAAAAAGDDEGPDDLDDDDGPRRGGIGGGGIEMRRLILVGVAIVILLIGGYWYVQRCQRNEEVDAYKSYVKSANAVTAQANRVGAKLEETFLKQGQTAAQLQTDMNELAKNQQAVVTSADELDSPGSMDELQARFLEAQQLRLNGLQGMAKALPDAFEGANGNVSDRQGERHLAAVLAGAGGRHRLQRLVQGTGGQAAGRAGRLGRRARRLAVRRPEPARLRRPEDDGGAADVDRRRWRRQRRPSRRPSARPNPDGRGLRRRRTRRPAAGLHGTSIETVTISGTTLNADDVTEVETDPDNQNSIVVAVKNGGDFQETQVEVQAFVDSEQVGDTGTIPVFDAGTTANVTFKFEPLFNKAKQSVKIVVKPVAGEENTANNSRTYQVIFKFPG